jgi:hypothetical protein
MDINYKEELDGLLGQLAHDGHQYELNSKLTLGRHNRPTTQPKHPPKLMAIKLNEPLRHLLFTCRNVSSIEGPKSIAE